MKYRIGIDIGGMHTAVGIVNEQYELVSRAEIPTMPDRMLDDVIYDIAGCVRDAVKKAGISFADCVNAGIGAPGYCIGEEGTVVFANNLHWKNIPICEELQQNLPELPVPLRLCNDADCAMLGEVIAGAARGAKNVVMLTLGTGVGGGVMIEGKLYQGSLGPAAELGHTTLVLDGEPCSCGRRGCFEMYASASALLKMRYAAQKEHPESSMSRFEPADGSAPFVCAAEGDAAAAEVVEKYTSYVGAGVTNFVNIFAPEIVVLGGGVSNAGDALTVPVEEYVHTHRYGGRRVLTCPVRRAMLGADAGIIGAAYLGEMPEEQ